MAMYNVYNNILIKLENVFLRVEMEVDREINLLLVEHTKLNNQLSDLKEKIGILNDLKKIYDLYCDKKSEMENIRQSFFEVICDKQIQLRFLREKELLLKGYLVPNQELTLPRLVKSCLQDAYRAVVNERVNVELEVDKFLYQYTIFQNGRKIIRGEIKNVMANLESVLFKEYAVKQKIRELEQYKVELSDQKDSFMKDPTVDGYTEAVQRLEKIEARLSRLMAHRNLEKLITKETIYPQNFFPILHTAKLKSLQIRGLH